MKLLVLKIVLNKFLFFIIVNILLANIPSKFLINSIENLEKSSNDIEGNLPSDAIIDMGVSSDILMFFGTGKGIGKSLIELEGFVPTFYVIDDLNLPEGGNPALYVNDSIIIVSGVIDTLAQGESFSKGTGISISQNYGETWDYYTQPIDEDPDNPITPEREFYFNSDWYDQSLNQLAVTVAINNVSYDITVLGDFVYIASWAGGIRRLKFKNNEEELSWENLPLPQDNSYYLFSCNQNEFLPQGYSINPNDPENGGNHNHKGFSVRAQGDSVIWVGTANGINKGIVFENNCINWTHYTSENNGLSGDWVIGFEIQNFNDSIRIWAITWSTNSIEENGISYSDNMGDTWYTSDMVENLGLKIYNIYSKGEKIYLASDKGLYVSFEGTYWEKLSRPIEYDVSNGNIVEEIIYDPVYSVAENSGYLWVGTSSGIGRTDNLGIDWTIYRNRPPIDSLLIKNGGIEFYAYPNPFIVGSQVRFVIEGVMPEKLIIYDYAMNKVVEISDIISHNGSYRIYWYGQNRLNQDVSNGVYFCNLIYSNSNSWTKLVAIN